MTRTEHLAKFRGKTLVYFVYSPTFRLMKIGKTTKPFIAVRWRQYVTESPEILTPVLVLASYGDLEGVIHAACETHLSHGEWFRWPDALTQVRSAIERHRDSGVSVEVAQSLHPPLADRISDVL